MMVRVSVSKRLPGSGGMSRRRSVASVVPRPHPELPGRFGHATEDQSQPCQIFHRKRLSCCQERQMRPSEDLRAEVSGHEPRKKGSGQKATAIARKQTDYASETFCFHASKCHSFMVVNFPLNYHWRPYNNDSAQYNTGNVIVIKTRMICQRFIRRFTTVHFWVFE